MMLEQLLAPLLTYGLVVLLPILLLSAIGVPLPGTLLLVAAGALAGSGQIALPFLLLGAFVATLAGNCVGYWLGWRGGQPALRQWGGRFHLDEERVARTRVTFSRYGLLTILFTRFPLSPLSAIVNILAGIAHYPLRTFLLVNVGGVAVWVGVYAGIGYVWGANWKSVANNVDIAAQILTILAVLAFGAFVLVQRYRYNRRRTEEQTPPHRSKRDG